MYIYVKCGYLQLCRNWARPKKSLKTNKHEVHLDVLSINGKLCYIVRHISIQKLSKNINVAVFNENCDIKTSRKRSYDRNVRTENYPTNAQKMHLIAYASRKKYSIITVLILYYFPFSFFREKNLSHNQGSNMLSS